jgi:acid phosphatase
MTLAGEVLTALNKTISSGGKSKLNIQFGAYATFLAYFGLAGLTNNVEFTGMPVYASSMVWELVTNASGTGMPSESDINVRFLFHNGTSTGGSTEIQTYPLFGQSDVEIPWTQFVDSTKKFAITSQQQWCQACGNSTGICSSTSDSSTNPSSSDSSSNGGMSLAVAGVIGAMVTLGVLAGLTALLLLVFNLRLVRKSALASRGRGSESSITPVAEKAA